MRFEQRIPASLTVTISYDLEDGTTEDWSWIAEPIGVPFLQLDQVHGSPPRIWLESKVARVDLIAPDNTRKPA